MKKDSSEKEHLKQDKSEQDRQVWKRTSLNQINLRKDNFESEIQKNNYEKEKSEKGHI